MQNVVFGKKLPIQTSPVCFPIKASFEILN